MKITRKMEIDILESRTVLIEGKIAPSECSQCGPGNILISVSEAAKLGDLTSRKIFELIGADTIHFTELPSGAIGICKTSLGKALQAR